MPRDEGTRRADFADFRRLLLQAVARHDTDAVLAIVHPQIRVAFDGAGGPEAFKEYHVNNPEEDFWTEFAAILRMGGRFRTEGEFDAPYIFAFWPDGVDSFECLAVTGRRVRLREAPSVSAPVLALLDFEVVQAVPEAVPAPGWQRVETADRRRGFIASRYLRSPIDHRALFAFQDGRWWLVAYIAGD